jgi:hypothetical protein
MDTKTSQHRRAWLAHALTSGAIPQPDGDAALRADHDFCDDVPVEECCRRIVQLALPVMGVDTNTYAASMYEPGRYLSRLLNLRHGYDQRA